MAEPTENTVEKRSGWGCEETRFKTGNSGRPKGSRNKLGEAFLADMLEDWTEHGKVVIEAVRCEKPDQYLKVVASILPKDLNINVNNADEMSDDELVERIRALAAITQPFLSLEGAGGITGGIAAKADKQSGAGRSAPLH